MPTVEARPLHGHAFSFFAAVHYVEVLKQRHQSSQHFRGIPVLKHLTYGPSLLTQKSMASLRFLPGMPLSQGPFLWSPGWLINQAPELPGCNMKPPLLHEEQGETEERGRPLQIGRWQV